MKIIGITGKSGSGKSLIASTLAHKLNAIYIDIDKIGHSSTNQPSNATRLVEYFGTEILNDDKTINRKKLGNIVFSDKQKLDFLNNLTLDYMQEQIDQQLSETSNDIIILDYMLLPIIKYWNMCSMKILVTASDTQRKLKVMARDGISEEYFNKRDSASIDYSKFKFDYIINNDYTRNALNKAINALNLLF